MASSFDRWEKDPFFNAAEEVQESADRVESLYRTWIHAMKDASSPWNSDELRRDLRTALDTAKWQLEEFQHTVRSSYSKRSSDDARNRHQDFVVAIDGKISKVEHLLQLQESVPLGSKASMSMPWVSLDEGERNELASFLSGMPLPPDGGKPPLKCTGRGSEKQQLSDIDSFRETVDEKPQGHCRVASANVDISSWKIAVSDNVQQSTSSNDSSGPMHKGPMHKVASLSGFFSSVESISKFKWPKNGYKKLKAMNHHQETDNPLLPSTDFNGAINACNDECYYDKPLQGWYGDFQRKIQRSQYKMQYNRPVQVTVWIVIILCFIGAGESGKSTIFKQIKLLFQTGFDETELRSYTPVIFANVYQTIKVLHDGAKELAQNDNNSSKYAISEENKDIGEKLSEIGGRLDYPHLTKDLAKEIETLWEDAAIQETYARGNELQVPDCTKYFMENLQRLSDANYVPTKEDVLYARVRTTGVVEIQFSPVGENKRSGEVYRLFDVGGQRNERRKWIHLFEGVTAVIFCAAISDYDQTLFEDESKNRMMETKELFEWILKQPCFEKTSFMLFLNKFDIFEKKILNVPLNVCSVVSCRRGGDVSASSFNGVNGCDKIAYVK